MLPHCSGALPFLRDPYDADNEEPFGQIMTAPLREQMTRAGGAFLVMACLSVVLVHLPIQLAIGAAPQLFPLRLRLADALAEVPADLLLFHVCLPLTLPHLNLRCLALTAHLRCLLHLSACIPPTSHYK